MSRPLHRLPYEVPWRQDLPPVTDRRTVRNLLPAGYEEYLRIFHPFVPWGWRSRDPTPSRTTWRALATAAGVPFSSTLAWRDLASVLPVTEEGGRSHAVWEGEMEARTAIELLEGLGGPDSQGPYLYAFGLAAMVATTDHQPILFRSDALDIEAARLAAHEAAGRHLAGPEAVWPVDHRWLVVSDYDLVSTYVATDAGGATRVRSRPYLEVVGVDLDTVLAG